MAICQDAFSGMLKFCGTLGAGSKLCLRMQTGAVSALPEME